MKKTQLKSSLRTLGQLFSDDDQAQTALKLLLEKVEHLAEPEARPEGHYPLPREIGAGHYALFSDGACRGNPGPGAWAAIGQNSEGDIIFEAAGVDARTTNNQMELQAAIESFKQLKNVWHEEKIMDAPVFFYSDSQYVVKGLNEWMAGWKRRGWKKADKKEPENLTFWQELDRVVQGFSELSALWVKGHAGHPQNEHCDQLANQALDEAGL